jgi:protein TonB
MCNRIRWFGVAILAATFLGATGPSLATEELGPSAQLIPGSRVSPVYPPAAFAARFSAEVTLSALVRADGTVGDIEVLDSTRNNLGFEDASKAAVAQWRFEPARVDGQPVDSHAVLRLSFGMDRRDPAYIGGGSLYGQGLAGLAGASAKGASTHSGGGNSSNSRHNVQATIKKVKVPDACEGCLYDRRTLFPPASDPTNHPN